MKRSLVILLLLLMVLPAGCSKAKREPGRTQAKLGSDITFTAIAARSWVLPETKFALRNKVPEGSFYPLEMGGSPVNGGGVVLEAEGVSGFQVTRAGSFARKCVKLVPPKGKYLEALLMFHNTAARVASVPISGEKASELDVTLMPSEGEARRPLDFLAPGFATSDLSELQDLQKKGLTAVSSFSGKISMTLEADGRTWLLVLFDAPRDSDSAKLRVANSESITLSF